MCGIAAIINPSAKGSSEMDEMLDKIRQRGDSAPQQIQVGNAILGSVRLRIVDIPNGMQPFFNETKTIAVILNGEIYNFKELRSGLEAQKHTFLSDCDTEVLVHLYEEYGIDFLDKLEGMFAFLLYDLVGDKFFGVRDFFGVKPFYYCQNGNAIYVSSEMKSFLTIEAEIWKELKPGHYLTKEGITQYYTSPVTTRWNTGPVEEIRTTVRALVESAVKKRVATDLPIATFLSGGIDSSIVHLLCCQYHKNVTALIIGEDSGEDVIYAKRLCHDLNLQYYHIRTTREALVDHLPELIYTIETFEPNPVRGSLLSMQLASVAHEHGFKVVLCGEGSDEIFGGYGDFLYLPDESAFQSKIEALLADLYRTQLLRIDKTGMKYSVEVREPFLDRALVEYALTIAPSLKVTSINSQQKTTKYILREAFRYLLPEYIYTRDKMTLMEGAGIGGVERGKGLLHDFTDRNISEQECQDIKERYPEYAIRDKEEAYCFKLFYEYYSKADFSKCRVINAQKEIFRPNEH